MAAHEEGVVVSDCAARGHRGHDRLDLTEELHGGINQMAVQIQEQPAALVRGQLLAPPVFGLRSPPLPAVLEPERLAEHPAAYDVGQGGELGVIAAVLEHREGDVLVHRPVHQIDGILRVERQRFVDDDRDLGLDNGPRVVDMGCGRRGDDHQVQSPGAQHLRERGMHDDAGEVCSGLGGPVRVGGHYGDDVAPGSLQRPSVNVPSRHAVPDDAHTRHGVRVCRALRAEAYAGGYAVRTLGVRP